MSDTCTSCGESFSGRTGAPPVGAKEIDELKRMGLQLAEPLCFRCYYDLREKNKAKLQEASKDATKIPVKVIPQHSSMKRFGYFLLLVAIGFAFYGANIAEYNGLFYFSLGGGAFSIGFTLAAVGISIENTNKRMAELMNMLNAKQDTVHNE